jgi:biopolymer transport protein ExbD
MTSLIDVIFLLLLFFMLSSTFSKFAEVDLVAGGSGSGTTALSGVTPVFVSLAPESLRLNGAEQPLAGLAEALAAQQEGESPLPVLVALSDGVSAQRLTDLLAALRGRPGLAITVLGAS